MTLHSLSEALADSAALMDLAKGAGITAAQARLFVAALGDLDAQQVVRICGMAARDRLRQTNRTTRKADER